MLVLVAAWSSLCAVATGALVWFIMDSRMQVRLARQREKLAEARATLETQKQALEQEIPISEGADLDALARTLSVFSPDLLMGPEEHDGRHRMLR